MYFTDAGIEELDERRGEERVQSGIAALKGRDVKGFGALMFQSHESSRVNFENSTAELDALVAIARVEPGVRPSARGHAWSTRSTRR